MDCITNNRTTPDREVVARDQVARLKWSEPHASHSYPNWHAIVYAIRFEARIDTSKPLLYGKFPLSICGSMVTQKFDTIDAAKAYAQAAFEDRVLSCFALSTAPKPEPVAPQSGIRSAGDLDFPAPNHFDPSKRGFDPK